MNRSLELALCFVGLPEIAQTAGAGAWVCFQESGRKPNLSEDDKRVFDKLCAGWRLASAQVLMWIDDIVFFALDGVGWHWFWADYEDATPPIKRMANSLRKSIEKEGLMMFLVRHPRLRQKPSWQKYVFG